LNTLEVSVDIEKYLHDLSDSSLQDFKARIRYDYERSLSELNVGYLDLLLMHWPGLWGSADQEKNARLRKACWEVFEDLYLNKRVRAIGVSNFLVRHLEEFFEPIGLDSETSCGKRKIACRVLPMVNQIEVSPYLQQREIVAFCKEHGIVVQAWGPFGSGATGVLTDSVISEIAQKYSRNNGQIILRWLLQHGLTALPKSLSAERMKANLEVFDFVLDNEDMARIDALERGISSVQTAEDIA
jgi:diketogulonate reductase-like aldo/keto reductase